MHELTEDVSTLRGRVLLRDDCKVHTCQVSVRVLVRPKARNAAALQRASDAAPWPCSCTVLSR